MSNQQEKDGNHTIESIKQSVRHAVEQMSVLEITALIEFAEQTRRQKQDAARDELLADFRKRASELGYSLEDLMFQASAVAKPGKSPSSSRKLSPRYRGPNGEEWMGRGRVPKWLHELEATGHKRDDFAA